VTSAYRHTSPPPSNRASLPYGRYTQCSAVSPTARPAVAHPCVSRQQGRLLLLRELHWLRVPERITFRLCVLTHRCLNGSAPAYLAENIRLTADVESRRHLRSSTTTTLVVPPVQRFTLGDRAFPVAAQRARNSLPPSLRTVFSLVPFRHQLKTFLFVHSFD